MANLLSSKLTLTKILNGQDGLPGSTGANGYNSATIYLYLRAASEPSAPSSTLTYTFTTGALSPSSALGNWSLTMPNNNSNPCWVAIAAAISNISTDTIESNDWIIRELVENGANGSPGVSITGVVEEYAINNNSTTAPTTGWSTSLIAPTSSNRYLWNREVISYSSGNPTTTTPHIAGMYSEDGADGKGISSIVNTYAINNDSTTAPVTGWEETPMAPTSSNKYLWNKEVVNYTTGSPTTTTRVIGTFSEDGYNLATIYLYLRTTATSVSAPTGYSYTFSTNTISPTLTTWSRAIPSGTDPCWVTSAVVVSRTDSNNQLNFVTPTLMVKNGANGASYATVYLYKRGSSAPAKPNGDVIYTFSTGAVTGSLNSWTRLIPTGTDPCWMIVALAVASAGSDTDTISSTEWSTQTKIVENGADGAPGADGVTITGTIVEYKLGDSGTTPPTGTWSTTMPSIEDLKYLWTRTTVSYSDSTPDTVSYSVSYKAKNGANGTSVTITSKSITYQKSDSGTTTPTGTWSSTIPTVEAGKYLWTRTIVNYSDGNSTTAYSVSKMGTNGTNGADGADGYNTATVFLYKRGVPTSPATYLSGPTGTLTYTFTTGLLTASNSSYFNGWSLSIPEVNNDKDPCWVTTAAAISLDSSININTNLWSQSVKLVEDGEDGVSVTGVVELYAINNNNTTPPDESSSDWGTTLISPTSTYRYLWNREVISYSNGNLTKTTPHIASMYSEDGKGISSIKNYYARTTNTTAPSIGSASWVECPPGSIPTLDTTNKYLWNYENTLYTDNSNTHTTPHIISMYAKDGTSITVTQTAYGTSNSSSTEPANWTVGSPTNIPNGVWLWIKTTFSDGSSIKSCSYSGNNGTNGYNSATVYLYQRKDGNAPTAPAGILVYKFEDGSLTGILGNWLTSLPNSDSNHYPCYVAVAAAISNTGTDEILSTDWTITKLVEDGTNGTNGLDGYNQATIYLYKRSDTSITTAPSGMTYKFSNDTVYNIPTGWTRTIPASDSNHYPCYVTSASVLTRDPNASVNLTFVTPTKLVEDGQDGEDANQYQVHTNYQVLYKFDDFDEQNNKTLYIDSPLEITAYDIKNSTLLPFRNIGIQGSPIIDPSIKIEVGPYNLSEIFLVSKYNTYITYDLENNMYYFNIDKLYGDYKNWVDGTIPTSTFDSSINLASYSNIKLFFDSFFGTYIGGTIHIVLNGTEPNYIIERFIDLKNGISDEMMKFSVNARSINAAVDNSYLAFNNKGLSITNGNFVIYKKVGDNNPEPLLEYDGNDLNIVGNGTFTGTIHATNGDFTGTIYASSGTIGGFEISENKIASTDKNLVLYSNDGNGSRISVQNIDIGTGAKITEYLLIGNLKLLDPIKNNNLVILLKDNNDIKFSLDNNGNLIATNANISGVINASSGTFSGDIEAATIRASTIETLNFITNNVRSMGGSYIFKPTYEIIDTIVNGLNITVTLNNADQFKSGDIVGLTTKSGIIYGSVYSKSNNNVIVNTAITGLNDIKFSTITWFGVPYNSNNLNSDVIIGINSDDSTSSILPKQSLVINDFTYNNTNSTLSSTIKLLLGKLSSAKDASGNELSGYGLYADNVYLHGSLVTETASIDSTTYAGVNTIPEVTDNIFSERIVFWAGATVANGAGNSPFYVTENGSIYASRGRFTGSVIAESIISNSTIETAVIKGTGNSPSLKIYNTDDDNNYGISFYRDEYEINNTTYPEQETLRITNKGIIHYYKNNSIINNTPIISFAENSENVNIKASSYLNGDSYYLNGLINYNNKSILTFNDNVKLAYNNDKYFNITENNIELKNTTIINKGNVTFTNVYSNTDKKLDYKVNSNGYYCLYVS